mmetsp:Transcript_25447/g.39411  ORF Transcript_25447/g.39411 Transcript_25447/m.39411 type:complete len:87 (-) Transcript_25447:27-287(-)
MVFSMWRSDKDRRIAILFHQKRHPTLIPENVHNLLHLLFGSLSEQLLYNNTLRHLLWNSEILVTTVVRAERGNSLQLVYVGLKYLS